METTGDLRVIRGEIALEWEIKDFFPLSDVIDKRYDSPEFYFSGSSWQISLYPNGQTEFASDGWIDVVIYKMSTGHPLELDYSINIKTIDGKILNEISNKGNFHKKGVGKGWKKIMSRSCMEKKKSELAASNDIIVMCTMKNNESISVNGSISSRYKEISQMMRKIFLNAKNTDFVLDIDGRRLAAHRMILEARSPVFAAMFSHDTKENKSGKVSIADVDEDTMVSIVTYMYTGDLIIPTSENVLPLYSAADKYDMKYIKSICSDFIIRNLSEDWVCDVIKFADLYQEEEIDRHAREYFKNNARKILKTENWKIFAKENHDMSVELLSSVVAALLPEE